MSLVEASKQYPCMKAAWIEFLGERLNPAVTRWSDSQQRNGVSNHRRGRDHEPRIVGVAGASKKECKPIGVLALLGRASRCRRVDFLGHSASKMGVARDGRFHAVS